MQIHTVKEHENIYEIARSYGVSPRKVIENNGITSPDTLAVGSELLIITPTRSYTVRGGDSIEAIAKRFCVSKSDIIKYNPALTGGEKIYPEELLAIKYAPPTHAICLVNGYLYDGWREDRLRACLPHLSYLTVSSYLYKDGGLTRLYNPKEAIRIAKENGKSVLIRLYIPKDNGKEALSAELTDTLIREAKETGADGVTLAIGSIIANKDAADELFEMKKRLLTEGLSLFIEGSTGTDPIYSDISDGIILSFDSCAEPMKKSFAEGEEKELRSFAEKCDFARVFTDISPFAYRDGKPIEIAEAKRIAQKSHANIEYDPERMICYFRERGFSKSIQSEIVFPSLKNIKAKLDLVSELGLVGVCIDIMRCPTEHLMMISTEFISGSDHFPI